MPVDLYRIRVVGVARPVLRNLGCLSSLAELLHCIAQRRRAGQDQRVLYPAIWRLLARRLDRGED